MVNNNLFVYGTLMDTDMLKKRWNIKVINKSSGTIKGTLFNSGWFPIFLDEGHDKVFGKILTIKDLEAILPSLDLYEGYNNSDPNSLYHRAIKKVTLENGTIQKVWVYIGNKNAQFIKKKCVEENRIKSGTWEEVDSRS